MKLFVYKPFTVLLMLFCSVAIYAKSEVPIAQKLSDNNWNSIPKHPFLFANNARIAAIKQQKDKVTIQLLDFLKKDAENILNYPTMNYPNGVNNMETARNVQGRIITLALCYRLFEDKRYFEKAKKELLDLAGVVNMGTGHFLDVGEAALAMGIGYDWLYNDLSVAERDKISTAIVEKALKPSLDSKEGDDHTTSWVNGNFNWNPVCHGGLTVAALAIAQWEPTLSRQVVERAIENIPYAGESYAPDGSFPEAPSYWSYGTTFYVFAIDALRSAFGTSCQLEMLPGFLKTADYYNQVKGPTGEDFNYSDYHHENINESVILWFGRELKRVDIVQDELLDISRLKEVLELRKNADAHIPVDANRFTPMELIWWNPEIKTISRTSTPLQYTAKGGLPLGIMRSAWNDTNASFLAIKGGTPNNSHGHMDAGSFVLEANGVRWALDLGTESYDKMRAAKLDLWNYSQNSSRWTTFRCGPEAHNILRFNNQKQDVVGYGTIIEMPAIKGMVGNQLNLTTLYKSQVEKVLRTVKLFANKSTIITDEWKTGEKPVEASFQWLTKSKVTKTVNGLFLKQNGKTLKITIETPFSKEKPEITIEDISAAKCPQDSPNPGVMKIVIKTASLANSKGEFKITAIPF